MPQDRSISTAAGCCSCLLPIRRRLLLLLPLLGSGRLCSIVTVARRWLRRLLHASTARRL
jgi:hypothetical protein